MLSQDKLNDVWWSGFCHATVAHAATTEEGAAGSPARMEWLAQHLPTCRDCQMANLWKGMEREVAQAQGYLAEYEAGRDTSKLPGFSEAFAPVMQAAMERGEVVPNDLIWLARMANRHGVPWQKDEGP